MLAEYSQPVSTIHALPTCTNVKRALPPGATPQAAMTTSVSPDAFPGRFRCDSNDAQQLHEQLRVVRQHSR